jgi:CubicO group peptidase (beta-lactamase class C family)
VHHDDWLTGRWNNVPQEAQVREPTNLARIDQYVAEHFPTLLSLLVLSHGALVFERYYHQSGAEDCVNVKSVTKSVISALVGIALREGYLSSLDQRVYEFFPQYFSATDDPRKREITLKHLLTLCSGLSWAEHESIPALVASKHWVQYALSLPLRYAPRERFVYSTLSLISM